MAAAVHVARSLYCDERRSAKDGVGFGMACVRYNLLFLFEC
jgi:hypothetical protein